MAVLIQHGLATHAQTREGPRMVTYYSISMRNILRLQRAGLYLALVEERMGKDGLAVFRAIMLHGTMSIGAARGVVGFSRLGAPAKKKFNIAVAKLVRERFIVAVTAKDSVTRSDRVIQAEATEVAKLDAPPTAKDLLKIRERISLREDEEYHSTTIIGLKRGTAAASADDHGGGASKVLIGPDGRAIVLDGNGLVGTGGGAHAEAEAEADAVDDKQCFRVYHDRLDVFLRNKQVVNYFSDKYNDAAGVVLKTVLRLTEAHTRTCRDRMSERVTANQIMQSIPPDARLEDAVDMGDSGFMQGSADGSGDEASAGRARRGRAALALLELLRTDASGVLNRADERGAGVYRVNFERAAAVLRDQCVDALIVEKHGSVHARIVRVLRDKQKLDEKAVSHFAMLPMDQCRERLHELSLAGFVATVEIPRTADRNPSRMFYLWHVDPHRQASAALRLVFQAMSNIIQRAAKEADARAPLLAKARREDVMADPSLLAASERKELRVACAARQRLDVAAARLDRMLLLVHDIAPRAAAAAAAAA
ncbi:RNA polymerase III subunit C82 [Coemansia biformis]|uniref:DNA-directed RNA polymerase III subunit RPC3 n=1 Tax=Coemansia biformis TaxID=1286918 RepID=A0A9W8CPA4_9FUNG|nr:RNA polymerase III subunit C82 [Coemansia biformis]